MEIEKNEITISLQDYVNFVESQKFVDELSEVNAQLLVEKHMIAEELIRSKIDEYFIEHYQLDDLLNFGGYHPAITVNFLLKLIKMGIELSFIERVITDRYLESHSNSIPEVL